MTSLSGGERRRLQLAAVLVEKPNLLILDEPTNDLDLQTVEVVEDLLSEYKGCLFVVSHDRTFMENLADRLFVVTGDGLVRYYDGLYSEVRRHAQCGVINLILSCASGYGHQIFVGLFALQHCSRLAALVLSSC